MAEETLSDKEIILGLAAAIIAMGGFIFWLVKKVIHVIANNNKALTELKTLPETTVKKKKKV